VHFGDVGSEFRAVDRISYSVNQGEVVGIVGVSGSGKSVSSLAIKCWPLETLLVRVLMGNSVDDLEIVLLSEVSQRKTNIIMILLICGN